MLGAMTSMLARRVRAFFERLLGSDQHVRDNAVPAREMSSYVVQTSLPGCRTSSCEARPCECRITPAQASRGMCGARRLRKSERRAYARQDTRRSGMHQAFAAIAKMIGVHSSREYFLGFNRHARHPPSAVMPVMTFPGPRGPLLTTSASRSSTLDLLRALIIFV